MTVKDVVRALRVPSIGLDFPRLRPGVRARRAEIDEKESTGSCNWDRPESSDPNLGVVVADPVDEVHRRTERSTL